VNREPSRDAAHRAAQGDEGQSSRLWGVVLALTVLAVIAATAAGIGPIWSGRHADSPEAVPDQSRTAAPQVRDDQDPIVVAISVDGLNPDALERLGREATPTFHRLIDEGAATLNARTAFEATITLPNHAGMLTGRTVAGPQGHDVTMNVDPGGTLADRHGSYVAGMFDVAHNHGLSTALLAQKEKFAFFTRSWDDGHGADDDDGGDDGRDKVDIELVADDAPVVKRLQEVLIGDEADLVFVHLRAPDKAGHRHGWLGAEYLAAVRSVDHDLGQIVDVIDASPDMIDRVTIVLTADHGGPEGSTAHDNPLLAANYRIPFIVWGRGVVGGADLYALNPGRQDPGETRPDYSGRQPIRNLDIESTALGLLGLPAIEGTDSASWPVLALR